LDIPIKVDIVNIPTRIDIIAKDIPNMGYLSGDIFIIKSLKHIYERQTASVLVDMPRINMPTLNISSPIITQIYYMYWK